MLQPCLFSIQKHISGFPHYTVDNYGRVRSLRNDRFLSPNPQARGYQGITLNENGNRKKILLHRIVLSSFIGWDKDKPNVDHKDNNTSNNNLLNLKWVTQSENVLKSYSTGNAKPTYAMKGRFGKLHGRNTEIKGYDKNGKEILSFESISLARVAGYSIDFYSKKYKGLDETICKGITFKKVKNGR